MEVFYSNDIRQDRIVLPEGESNHCVRVLRHHIGDEVLVSGGDGNLYRCTVTEENPKAAVLDIVSVEGGFGTHPYYLHIAMAPTKNIDRFEWFIEKAVEMGIDEITPLLCDHSERRMVRVEREEKVILSAVKQSLKGRVPVFHGMMTASELMTRAGGYDLKCIAFCDRELVNSLGETVRRRHIMDILSGVGKENPRILMLIGPEGDFSRDELLRAADASFTPVSLGESRLRTETAGVLTAAAVALSVRQGRE